MNPVLTQNKASWDAMADSWFGTTALPTYGCYIPNENELHLFPDLAEKKVLDIGCGSGHSLRFCGEHGTKELWGIDLSEKQIQNAQKYLTGCGYTPKLFTTPMEADIGLPKNYFDVVYSIYAIGWTTDLSATIQNVASYLKKDGIFIFSWDHPFMHCLSSDPETQNLIFDGTYTMDEEFSFLLRGQPVTLKNRRISTYINALADAGFAVEKLVEETRKETLEKASEFSSQYYAEWRAKKLPLSFIIKARKL